MCEWGTTIELIVPIPAELSHNGQFHWAAKPIDSCIAPLVKALNDQGIYTSGCCCGHGKAPGEIFLHDGRVLTINTREERDTIERAIGLISEFHIYEVGIVSSRRKIRAQSPAAAALYYGLFCIQTNNPFTAVVFTEDGQEWKGDHFWLNFAPDVAFANKILPPLATQIRAASVVEDEG